MNYLEPEKAKFTLSETGVVELDYDGKTYDGIILQRSFPLSNPNEFVSVRKIASRDDLQEEIAVIKDVSEFDTESQKVILEELGKRYFVPKVERIKSLKDDFGQIYIDIETNAGVKNIVTSNTSSNFIQLGSRLMIIDIDGNKYEVSDIRKIDKKSRKYLETVL